jgi:hypothetical protein
MFFVRLREVCGTLISTWQVWARSSDCVPKLTLRAITKPEFRSRANILRGSQP